MCKKSVIAGLTLILAGAAEAQVKDTALVLRSRSDSLFYYDNEISDKFYAFRRLNVEKDLDAQLLPLSEIIEIAVNNHPLVKAQEENIKSAESQSELSRRQWQQNIMGNINYFEGSQNQFTTLSNDVNQTSVFGNGLRYGVSVNIPLFEFSGRKSRIRQYEHQVQAQAYTRDEIKLQVAQEVIDEYTRLISAQRILKIQARGRDQTTMHLSNAELEFKTGDITVSEYGRIAETAKQAEVDFEMARREFFNAYYRFEKLVGEKMENLTVKR